MGVKLSHVLCNDAPVSRKNQTASHDKTYLEVLVVLQNRTRELGQHVTRADEKNDVSKRCHIRLDVRGARGNRTGTRRAKMTSRAVEGGTTWRADERELRGREMNTYARQLTRTPFLAHSTASDAAMCLTAVEKKV